MRLKSKNLFKTIHF